ncbi:hypothetical protein HBI56_153510 [Parastagonospora nodorum]|uniref:CCHC-type domain-containing protein n=2 Tax=Phaeosphaeria nodorum (strain SN15 / ATCC MYA-4574 / FGSC 10173) TaxID=321614 RepID=A0A7U2FGY9_PHANO|nr:hypothetical protein SNOG_11018 [Parastagonospora nodorum SN15]KAH3912528.1 hypothetical protein HBH56_116190 [Parastagonospora nodorum]EAT81517.1 hypothetical protein SNOG_11018 [Parastagonospora nodorum SN15]KAH3928722.1 hypothetical protein HBH54_132970 [Parastagonospora nodorum]KAH3950548.1 hypothetical protein HBH53_073270 [Parastagonospora nodorum]KAH3965779.1 hypothetical protein HBH51_148500 [Parastagonospora nodorum]
MASNTPKTMSSRLMTMKFMQRSAHKATASSPKTPNGPPSKRARLSNGRSAPGTPDQEIIQSAIDLEEKKRQEALDKAAQHSGETKWVLSFTDPLAGKRQESLQVQHAGFAEIDAADESDEDEEEVQPIRKKYGGGIKRKDKPIAFEKAEQSEGEISSSSEDEDYDSDDPTAALIRETRREVAAEHRKPRDAQPTHNYDSPGKPRRDQNGEVNIRGLTSLSGQPRDQPECFQCGQKGHMKSDCPKGRGSAGRGRGRGRK